VLPGERAGKETALGLLDRFKGESEEEQGQLEPNEPSSASDNAGGAASNEPAQDHTSEWITGSQSGPSAPASFTGIAGSINRLTHSDPVDPDDEAPADTAAPERDEVERSVEPVSEERLDELMAAARKGHSSRDVEAVWDAIMASENLHLLQRVKGPTVEAHALESPLGPMLPMFTSRARAQALVSTKAFRNQPFAFRVASMPLADALDWAIGQRVAGVEAIEVNRGVDPGFATLLQMIPERYQRVRGRSLSSANSVAPDFEPIAQRLRYEPSQARLDELYRAFFGLQRWFAIKDAKRPNQPAFVPLEDKPTLMLFTSRAEAAAGAQRVGRERDWPKALMTLQPSNLVKWMGTLPGLGAPSAVVNMTSTPFRIDLTQIGSLWDRYRS